MQLRVDIIEEKCKPKELQSKQIEDQLKTKEKAHELNLPLATNVSPPPVGLPNGGNHCWLISVLQVLFNTPSWRSILEADPALRPVLAYQKDPTQKLDLKEVRRQIGGVNTTPVKPLPRASCFFSLFTTAPITSKKEEEKLPIQEDCTSQEDPIGYIFRLGKIHHKELSIDRSYFDERTRKSSPKQNLSQTDPSPILSLGAPKPNDTLNDLLKKYFCETYDGFHYKNTDGDIKLVDSNEDKTIIKKSLAGEPPKDFLMQINRYNYGVSDPSCPPEDRAKKIKTPIDIPLTLQMDKEWFDKQKNPIGYECQGFLCHKGESVRSGHYVAYVKKGSDWYHCNDLIIKKISEDDAKKAIQQSYILSYKKVC